MISIISYSRLFFYSTMCKDVRQSCILPLWWLIILCTVRYFVISIITFNKTIKHRFEAYLFPEGFTNVGVLFTDIACYHNSIFRQGQCHVQCVVTCINSYRCKKKSSLCMTTERGCDILHTLIQFSLFFFRQFAIEIDFLTTSAHS